MRLNDYFKKIFAAALMLGLAAPLPLIAQEEKKPEEKKVEEKKPETPPLPLKVAETIKFTTNEGTWMSLDVSPDGKWITFDMLGDIYVMPVEGGVAKRVHAGMSFESQPKFSPDGGTILFISDRSGAENLWTMKADGADAKAVTKDTKAMFVSPNWTEDGNYIIASKAEGGIGTYYPFMYHKDGGSGVSIGPPAPPLPGPGSPGPAAPRTNTMGLQASPEGKFFYLLSAPVRSITTCGSRCGRSRVSTVIRVRFRASQTRRVPLFARFSRLTARTWFTRRVLKPKLLFASAISRATRNAG